MAYEIEYLPAAVRALRSLDRKVNKRLLARIESLQKNPRGLGTAKLSGKLAGEEAYRVRAGDFRIIYAIADEKLVVLIVDVGHRRDIYRRR